MLVLDQPTAQRIVERTMLAIGHSVNVMSPDGVIIASGEPRRVGSVHAAARLVAQRCEPLLIEAADVHEYPGSKPGVNLPVTVGGQLAAVVGISGSPGEVSHLADLVCMTAELMLEQAALLAAGQHRRRQIEETLLAACEGKPVPAVWFEQLGIDMSRQRVALLVEATSQKSVDQVLAPLLPAVEQRHKTALAMHLSPRQLLLFLETEQPQPGPEEVRRLLNLPLRDDVILAVGATFSTHFQMGYQSARMTLEVGRRQAPDKRDLHYADFHVAVLWHSLGPGWQQSQLQAVLDGLLDHRHGALYLRTLERYIDCDGQIPYCAEQLHVHPNTVRYRLHKVESLTGLSPFSMRDLLVLQLALVTR
ncbi:CdaR family transcriptional regulator [Marinobacter sp. JSM 1782161]|uniref:CdaR family transcriptional regulator n=1 Tax=Marinobacter sp. JSM 1782161 TaxID=2685906 RepID=UPI001403B733|nr:sugar diacid recognition domain-containing protein [Marinobacter sp. JSM 1782161]